MPQHTKNQHEWTDEAWKRWLELLSPSDFFVTVDSFPLWRRHLAWAKPDGKELRDILTLRFSSTMVLLSLLLGTEMGVLFNPNETTKAMREAMAAEAYGNFKFWIGVTVWISAFVTVIGLVGTFAAWGMVASISAENAHCLLRSSIGQHVASQPAHFVTAALYLFLLWLLMFLVDMLHGPLRIVLVVMAVSLFFQVIVPLSAFGRLIMHTGGMSSKRILDPEYEKCLLPHALHTGLLMTGTLHKRKRVSVLSQYRHHSFVRGQSQGSTDASISNNYGSLSATGANKRAPRESVQAILPRPSVLNSMHASNLRDVVERVLALKGAASGSFDLDDELFHGDTEVGHSTILEESASQLDEVPQARQPSAGLMPRLSTSRPLSIVEERDSMASVEPTKRTSLIGPSGDSSNNNNVHNAAPVESSPSHPHKSVSGLRQSMNNLILGHINRVSRIQMEHEWVEENAVRELYDLPPPAELVGDYDDDINNNGNDDDDDDDDEVENQFNSIFFGARFFNAPRPTLDESDDPSIGHSSPGETDRLLPEKG